MLHRGRHPAAHLRRCHDRHRRLGSVCQIPRLLRYLPCCPMVLEVRAVVIGRATRAAAAFLHRLLQSSRVGLRFTVRPRPLPACFPSCSGNHLIQVVLARMGYAGAQHEFTIMEDDDDDSRLPSAATCFVRVTLSRFVARVCLLLIRCHHAPRTRSACPITAANRRCRRDF